MLKGSPFHLRRSDEIARGRGGCRALFPVRARPMAVLTQDTLSLLRIPHYPLSFLQATRVLGVPFGVSRPILDP